MDQIQANVLELAGNFLLQTKEADRECSRPQRKMQEWRGVWRGEGRPGPLPHGRPQGWAALMQAVPGYGRDLCTRLLIKSEGEASAAGPQSEGRVGLRKKGQGLGNRAFGNNSEGSY